MHFTKRYNHTKSILIIFFLLLLNSFELFAQNMPIINEVMSVKKDFIADDDGMYSDWIELYNPGDVFRFIVR